MTKSADAHEILTRVSAGTPMGELFRRFWMPALLSDEIEKDGAPVRLRILGEDLVAFRETGGSVGVISAYCPHRGAPLYLGRNEECGLRCVYHGWKFDIRGNCLDIPNIVPPDNFEAVKQRVNIAAYPTEEAGGLVWVYMGPAERKPPSLPPMHWLKLPPTHVHVSRWLQRSNWAQGFEGEIDSSHLTFVHGFTHHENTRADVYMQDGAPEITVRQTDLGFIYGARRRYNGQYYWRVVNWLLPMWSVVPPFAPDRSFGGRGWLPVDDEHTITFAYRYQDEPLSESQLEETRSGRVFPPRMEKGTFALPDGTVMDTFLPLASRDNDYLLNRDMQKSAKYSAILGINEEDRGIQEGMRHLQGRPGTIDRRLETLVKSDAAIVAARSKLVQFARQIARGDEPIAVDLGNDVTLGGLSIVTPIGDFDELLVAYRQASTLPTSDRGAMKI